MKNNNDCFLKEIQQYIKNNPQLFSNLARQISISTLSRICKEKKITTKNLETIPKSKNTLSVLDNRYTYVREIMLLESDLYTFIYVDETGFNLHVSRKRGRNLIGKRAVVQLPTQRGGNLSAWAALSSNKLIHFKSQLKPFNSVTFIHFLNEMYEKLDNIIQYVVILDNVAFHKTQAVINWFTEHNIMHKFLPPYSPMLNAIEECFSKVKLIFKQDRPTTKQTLLDSVTHGFNSIQPADCDAWVRHTRAFFCDCLSRPRILKDPCSDDSDTSDSDD